MQFRKLVSGISGLPLAVGGLALAVAPASADEVWHQSVGRSGPTAACPTTSEAELVQGWTQWTGSWAHWVNNGGGGYVCNRSLVWALSSGTDSAESAVGCVLAQDEPPTYPAISVDFAGSDSSSTYYFGAGCTGTSLTGSTWAYASDEATAIASCGAGFVAAEARGRNHGGDPNVWLCNAAV